MHTTPPEQILRYCVHMASRIDAPRPKPTRPCYRSKSNPKSQPQGVEGALWASLAVIGRVSGTRASPLKCRNDRITTNRAESCPNMPLRTLCIRSNHAESRGIIWNSFGPAVSRKWAYGHFRVRFRVFRVLPALRRWRSGPDIPCG